MANRKNWGTVVDVLNTTPPNSSNNWINIVGKGTKKIHSIFASYIDGVIATAPTAFRFGAVIVVAGTPANPTSLIDPRVFTLPTGANELLFFQLITNPQQREFYFPDRPIITDLDLTIIQTIAYSSGDAIGSPAGQYLSTLSAFGTTDTGQGQNDSDLYLRLR